MSSKSYRTVGAILIILGIAVGFVAAGSMDGGSPLEILLVLVLAAMSLLASGIAFIKAAEELDELLAINSQLFNALVEDCAACEIDYSTKERESQ